MSKAIYAGSFDPFTNGHLDIIKQASPLFERIYVVVANNPAKEKKYDQENMLNAIAHILQDEYINASAHSCNYLIAQYAKENNCKYLIRGLRGTYDYIYEDMIAKVNTEIYPELKTIYFRGSNEAISSSMVNELVRYKLDVSKYVSKYVLKIIG